MPVSQVLSLLFQPCGYHPNIIVNPCHRFVLNKPLSGFKGFFYARSQGWKRSDNPGIIIPMNFQP